MPGRAVVVVLREDAKVQETMPLIDSVLAPFHHRRAVGIGVVNSDGEFR